MAIRTRALYNGYGDILEARRLRLAAEKITPTIPDAPAPAPDSVTAETLATKVQPAPERIPYTYPYTTEEKLAMKAQTSQIQVCPPTCPEGYSAPGVLLPGWFQPHCIAAPCPAMKLFDIPETNGPVLKETVAIGVDENGDVITAEVEKKPNWLPLALAAGAAYFFMM